MRANLNRSTAREGIALHTRKQKPAPPAEFTEWTGAHFQTEEYRDCFLRRAATELSSGDIEVEPVADQRLVAMVRWRPGSFLGLNDLAHANGGRIAVSAGRGHLRFPPQ
jgi:hypothetical protein